MRTRIIIILILIAVSTGGWHFYDKYRVEHAPLVLHGNVDIRGVDLGFRVAGRIGTMLVDEGDAVKAGDLIARLDDEPYRRDLDQAEAALALAKADLDLKQAGYRPEEIEQARAQLNRNQVTASNARRVYERQAALVESSGVSRQSFENAEAALHEAEQQVKVAEASLKNLEAGFRREEIAAAAASLAQAEAAVELAKIRLADTGLKSPSDGIVITRAVEAGAIVQAGATVMSLSLEDPVWVRAYVHEPDLGKFPPGTKVTLVTDSRPDQPYHGTVGFVSPRAEFTPKSVETEELRTSLVYRMRVVVADSDGALRQGMPVTLSLDEAR
ncbi:secretion protein HlyD [Luteolibacter marinus]|uniref:secretion protein HlyD n=1 Tax=Luteolibacter marinus TaxID=2776705 RepID=UPI001866C61D|nr:secretion protein HlyD [Luteolibacter marinus]